MISRDFILLALLGIVVVLAAVTLVTQVTDSASTSVDERSESLGDSVSCVFDSENPEKCRDNMANKESGVGRQKAVL